MLQKIIYESNGFKIVCEDDSKKKTYRSFGNMPENLNLKLDDIRGPLLLPAIPKGAKLAIATSSNIVVQGNLSGSLHVHKLVSTDCDIWVHGNVEESGEIVFEGCNLCQVKNVAGKIKTGGFIAVQGSVLATATIDGKSVGIKDKINTGANITWKDKINYNKDLNPDFATKEQTTVKSAQKINPTAIPSSNLMHKLQPKTVTSYINFNTNPKKDYRAEQKKIKQEADSLKLAHQRGDLEIVALGKQQHDQKFTLTESSTTSATVAPYTKVNNSLKRSLPLPAATQAVTKKINTTTTADDLDDFIQSLEREMAKKPHSSDKGTTATAMGGGFEELAQQLALEQELGSADNLLVNSTKESSIANFESKRLQMIEHMKKFINEISPNGQVPMNHGGKQLILRKPQRVSLNNTYKFLSKNITHGHKVLATGTGKTIDMLVLWVALGMPRLLIIESRSLLINQVIKEFLGYLPNLKIGIFDGSHKDLGKLVTATTYQSLQLQYKLGEKSALKPGDFDLVFADEAHNALAKGRHESISQFYGSAFVIGCSATPTFNTKRDKKALKSMDQLFGSLIYEYSYIQAMEDKILPPCQHVKVSVNHHIDFASLRKATKESSNGEETVEYKQKELAKQLDQQAINCIPVEMVANGFNELTGERIVGKTGMVFAMGVENAKNVAKEFNTHLSNHPLYKNKTVAVALHGGLDENMRDLLTKRYNEGDIKIIVNDKLCTEGFDVQRVEFVILMGPHGSIVSLLQKVGRGGRQWLANPLKVNLILEMVYPGSDQITFDQYLGAKKAAIEGMIQKVPASSTNNQPLVEKILHGAFIVESGTFTVKQPEVTLGLAKPVNNELDIFKSDDPETIFFDSLITQDNTMLDLFATDDLFKPKTPPLTSAVSFFTADQSTSHTVYTAQQSVKQHSEPTDYSWTFYGVS